MTFTNAAPTHSSALLSTNQSTRTNCMFIISSIYPIIVEINNKEEEFKAYLEERRIPSTSE
jgi:hypothetical protein